ncbi:Lariat debranching enzyme [Geodia barretti]|uniref:Lariat debranching enzyme n=1 Tax=Geodia barretti TaxID=519541 RepID=A0AA35XM32_GEOBA|nr:Lariat debranching enzyme [Geodia barretti]
MKVVVEGCCHGELDQIYDVIGQLQEREGVTVDLLICCGDFQAVRDRTDLDSMAVPLKYREMGSFYKYYSGEKTAPVLTIFIGGNHEASNHLWELSYGGWVAPRIFYLGRAGVVRCGGLRIAGLSGIYKEGDYRKGTFERPSFSEGTKRSVYHVRSCDVFRLKQMEAESLGSPAAMELLQHLSPDYWFSAHLHVKFAAVYHHDDGDESGVRITKFLALDKCLPGRRYLQVLDIDTPSPPPYKLCYDAEWLAILRSTEHLMSYSRLLWLPPHPSTDSRLSYTPTSEEVDEVKTLFHGNLVIPDNFTSQQHNSSLPENRQTAVFCATLGISNPFSTNFSSTRMSLGSPGNSLCGNISSAEVSLNPDEIDLGDDSDENEEEEPGRHGDTSELTKEISAAPNTSTPDRKRYPGLMKTHQAKSKTSLVPVKRVHQLSSWTTNRTKCR